MKRSSDIEKRLTRIVAFLQKHYDAKAIILCGSRVVGDYHKESDWDFFVFTPKLQKGEDRRMVDNRCGSHSLKGETDIDCYWVPVAQKFDFNVFRTKLRYAKVILDTKSNVAKKVMIAAQKFYQKPPQWTKEKMMVEKRRGLRYLQKMNYLLKAKEYEQFYRRLCWFYAEFIPMWWFGLRGEWEMRSQQAYAYIKEKDPNVYKQIQIIILAKSLKEKHEACKKVQELIFP